MTLFFREKNCWGGQIAEQPGSNVRRRAAAPDFAKLEQAQMDGEQLSDERVSGPGDDKAAPDVCERAHFADDLAYWAAADNIAAAD